MIGGIGGIVGEVLAKLAVTFLREYLARKDLSDKIKLELQHEVDQLAMAALQWKADAAASPGGGAELRVREGGGTIPIPGEDPRTPRIP